MEVQDSVFRKRVRGCVVLAFIAFALVVAGLMFLATSVEGGELQVSAEKWEIPEVLCEEPCLGTIKEVGMTFEEEQLVNLRCQLAFLEYYDGERVKINGREVDEVRKNIHNQMRLTRNMIEEYESPSPNKKKIAVCLDRLKEFPLEEISEKKGAEIRWN